MLLLFFDCGKRVMSRDVTIVNDRNLLNSSLKQKLQAESQTVDIWSLAFSSSLPLQMQAHTYSFFVIQQDLKHEKRKNAVDVIAKDALRKGG